ncbi:MAG TPA: nitrate- and nitrite sensing domain-containing protein, partial [Oligoflexia bacterium]|nr:nitrate- and nitrite sensing domain-containing protein [Oligoflexia bacterium]
MKIKHKLAVLALMPMLAFCFQSWRNISANINENDVVDIMRRNAALVRSASELAAELQKERGKTSLHLAGGLDLGAVQEQRRASDGKLKAFTAALEQSRLDDKTASEASSIGETLASLRASSLSMSGTSLRDNYAKLIKLLIDTQAGAARAPTTRGVGKVFGAIVLIETAKENGGMFRALLSSLIAQDKRLSLDDMNLLVRFKSSLDANLNSPGLSGSEKLRPRLAEVQESDAWRDAHAAFVTVLGKWNEGGFGLDGRKVFATITRVIDDVGAVVAQELEISGANLEKIAGDIRQELFFSLVVFGLMLVVSLGAIVALAGAITKPLGRGVEFAEAIRLGDLSTRLRLGGKDEISRLGAALDAMADSLEGKAKAARRIADGDLTRDVELASDRDVL